MAPRPRCGWPSGALRPCGTGWRTPRQHSGRVRDQVAAAARPGEEEQFEVVGGQVQVGTARRGVGRAPPCLSHTIGDTGGLGHAVAHEWKLRVGHDDPLEVRIDWWCSAMQRHHTTGRRAVRQPIPCSQVATEGSVRLRCWRGTQAWQDHREARTRRPKPSSPQPRRTVPASSTISRSTTVWVCDRRARVHHHRAGKVTARAGDPRTSTAPCCVTHFQPPCPGSREVMPRCRVGRRPPLGLLGASQRPVRSSRSQVHGTRRRRSLTPRPVGRRLGAVWRRVVDSRIC